MMRRSTWQAVVALGAVGVMLGLGTWQIQRMVWKASLIALREAHMAAQPAALPPQPVDPEEWEFRRVVIEGRFRHDREVQLYGRRLEHGTPGYRILTPVDTSAGTVLVDRGWVPIGLKAPENRADSRATESTRVVGIARAPRPRAAFIPENDAARDQWFWIDMAALGTAMGATLREIYVEADATPNPGGYPIGGQTRSELPDNHAVYAFIWYALAIACGVIYWLFRRRQISEGR